MGEIRLAKDSGFFCCEATEELGLGLPQPQSNGGGGGSVNGQLTSFEIRRGAAGLFLV